MNPSEVISSSQEGSNVAVGRTRRHGSTYSTKLHRNSSTSRSIKVFVDMKDLLSIGTSSHIRLQDNAEISNGSRSLSPSVQASDSHLDRTHDGINERAQSFDNDQVEQKGSRNPREMRENLEKDALTSSTFAPVEYPGSYVPFQSFRSPPARVLHSSGENTLDQYDPFTSESEWPIVPKFELDNTQSPWPTPLLLKKKQGSTAAPRSEHHRKQSSQIDKLLPQPPYHSFTYKKKCLVAILVSLAGSLSPLSSTAYFPAINTIAREFRVSKELVLLTVTGFMVVQGITPVLRMPFENVGRRPVLIGTLFLFSGASIGLVYTNHFYLLIALRTVQGGGSAALTAIGASVIGDISKGQERGNLMGFFGAVLIGSHFVSPVIGGALTYFLGFRSIFGVLFFFSSAVMVAIILLLPETLRSIAGNGTVKLGLVHRPLWSIWKSRDTPFNPSPEAPSRRPSLAALVEPFSCLQHTNIVASILFGSVVYAVWTAVIATTTLIFEPRFHLSTFLVGLAFLPSGAGSILSFYLTGWIMDRDYNIVELRYREQYNIGPNVVVNPKTSPKFPIYRARLRSLWWLSLIFIATTAGHGFSFRPPSIAVPLVLQFFISFSATAVLYLNGVLVADTYSGSSESVIAIMNLIRFSCGAATVGTVQLLFNRLGLGFTFVASAATVLAFMPILLVQWVFGSVKKRHNDSWWRRSSKFRDLDL